MNISRFFVDRPVFAAVLSILIVVAGLIGMRALPISEYPEVVPPSIVVRASYPGANPTVIAQTVATPLEEQINGVEDMLYMSSQATSDGVLTLKAEHKTEKEESDEKRHYHVVERSTGSYLRRFAVPFEPDQDKVEASFDKGVLKVFVPRSAAAAKQSKKIAIS